MKNIIDTRITFATSTLAKEKGFHYFQLNFMDPKNSIPGIDPERNHCFDESGKEICPKMYNERNPHFPRPTQTMLRNWLREVHNLHVVITPEFYRDGINYNYQVLEYDPKGKDGCVGERSSMMYGDNHEYPQEHLAIEAGIHHALTFII